MATHESMRHLIVRAGTGEYGLDVMQVREIAGMQTVTRVPRMPRAIEGVVNLHGRIVPVLDLRVMLGMDQVAATPATCFVVVRAKDERMAALRVDAVVEVMRLTGGEGRTVLDLDELLERSEG